MNMIDFGQFRLDCDRRFLTRDGVPVALEGRALDILIHLAVHKGTVVGKHQMIEAVWNGRMVEENNLAVHVSALRRIVGTARDGRSLIQTIPRRGYMLVSETDEGATRSLHTSLPRIAHADPLNPVLDGATNAFIGREDERLALTALLAGHGLVTITATGGMGKTRLSRQVAQGVAANFHDGVFVAELASVEDPARALEHVAAMFPIGAAEQPILTQLTAFLGDRQLLLVLDNCEHVLEPIASMTAAILDRCPDVTVLATSREPLGIAGERVFRLSPLSVPGHSEAITSEEALGFDAVRLFVDRATAAVPGFVFDDAAAPIVSNICARLDGIALAIEMAVPRLRVLTPPELAARLNESVRLLAAPGRTTPPRHRTLHATIDWSYALLPEDEQILFRRLAVFAGAADLAAVQAVAAEPGCDPLDQLTGLVDKSLVIARVHAGVTQYSFLQTIRQYAQQRLADSGELGLRRRHAAHYAAVFEAMAEAWPTSPTDEWLAPAVAAAAELRAALDWCFGPDGDVGLGLRLVGASTPIWWELPNLPLREARAWFDRAIQHVGPDTPPLIAARIWFGHAWREMRQADTANLVSAERAVALFRQTSDRVGLGAALWRSGSAALRPESVGFATDRLNEAEQVLRHEMPGKWLALVLVRQGDLHMRNGDNASALAAYEEAMSLAKRTKYWYGLTNGGANMADLLFQLGRGEEAMAQLRHLRSILSPGHRTPLTCTLASHLAAAGLAQEASEALDEVVALAPGIGYGSALARGMETLALLRARDGNAAVAARLAGYAWAAMSPVTRWGAPRAVFERLKEGLGAALAPADLDRYMQQGAAWDEAAAAVEAKAALDDLFRMTTTAS